MLSPVFLLLVLSKPRLLRQPCSLPSGRYSAVPESPARFRPLLFPDWDLSGNRLRQAASGGLWLLNAVSGYTGIFLPVNAVTSAIAGFLGLPGIALIALLEVAA